MPLVRSFHGERIALLALAQRPLAGRDPADLPQQRHHGQWHRASIRIERAHRDPDRLVAPRPQRHRVVARHRHLERSIPHPRDRDEVLALRSTGLTSRSGSALR